MNQKDKIKLAAGIVILVGAVLLIWWNLRDGPGPGPVSPAPGATSTAGSGDAPPATTPRAGRGQIAK